MHDRGTRKVLNQKVSDTPDLSERSGQGQDERSGRGQDERSGQGQDERSGQGQACRDMSRQRALQTSPGDRPATKPTNQEPTRSPRRPIRNRHGALGHQSPLSPCFLPYMGAPARAIKSFPTLTDSADSLYPADSLCFADPPSLPCLPAPGSSARE